MDQERRGNLAIGLILLLVGGWFLALQVFPNLAQEFKLQDTWAAWIIGAGLVFLVVAALTRSPGLAVPAAIIAGVGGILYYQNSTGDWGSWAYAWTLFPGFVGVGTFLMHLMEGDFRQAFSEGLQLVLISLILFGIFGSFLGGPAILGQYWPVLLILLGAWLLVRGFFRR